MEGDFEFQKLSKFLGGKGTDEPYTFFVKFLVFDDVTQKTFNRTGSNSSDS